MNNKKNILLFYNVLTTFVKKDADLLSSDFNVIVHDFYAAQKWRTPFMFLSQKLFLLRHIWRADLIVCEFAGYHSLLPALFGKVFGKKCLIIVCGTDAHYFPKIGYGNWQKKWLSKFTAFSYQLCSYIAPVHKSLMKFSYEYDINEPKQQGIYARMPNLKVAYKEINYGYNAEKWKCTKPKSANTFITVSGAMQYSFQQQLKGIDLILAVAPFFPQCRFTILGVPNANIIPNKPNNVVLLPPTPNNQLSDIYSGNEFYLQLSMAEGFPNAICEAMLCNCIPIGSNVFGLPDIIADSGFILNTRSVDELRALIEKALSSDKVKLAQKARKRITTYYPETKRKTELIALCNQLITA